VWAAWFEEEWNRPDRTDHYLMELMCQVRLLFAKRGANIQPEHFKLTFTFGESNSNPPLTPEESAKRSKARWLCMFDKKKIQYKVLSPEEIKKIKGEQ
jgi:hypothetical protein